MNWYWFLLLLIPALIRADIVFFSPALTMSKAERDITVRRGNDYTKAGLEAQQDWIGLMLILFVPFLILAVLGATHGR